MHHGFYTAAAAVPHITVADCKTNALSALECIKEGAEKGASLIVLPELCLTGYTSGDLFLQKVLLDAAKDALIFLANAAKNIPAAIIAGLPIAYNGALYNAAAVILRGKVLAVIPKTYIPNYGEFYEMRHFTSALALHGDETISIDGYQVPFGSVLVKDAVHNDLCIAVEICEDLWTALSPSAALSLNGATIIANLSCSNEVVGKADYRRLLVKGQSSRLLAAYIYADAGRGESTTDMVFSGHNIIAQNGTILCESLPFENVNLAIADIDAERLSQERKRMTTFAQCQQALLNSGAKRPRFVTADIAMDDALIAPCIKGATKNRKQSSSRPLIPNPYPLLHARPFVPDDAARRGERCKEVIIMQAEGLIQRLSAIYLRSNPPALPRVVVGLSGGLDSTLALLVSCKAFDILNLPRKEINAITMPCFGTTSRTLSNATSLAHELMASLRTIDITQSVKSHLKDIGLSVNDRTAAFENAQARERTSVLMDIANAIGGIVIGTGDLSELALGWCTYNGDQMSMYGVNSSIPKTLVRHLVAYFADEARKDGKKELSRVLCDILDTPVSPELLPPDSSGAPQSTEDTVGPYELHDFFLYYTVRFGFSPGRVFYLAREAHLPYSDEVIIKWMKVFYRRFFSQQFKRSAMPDGAKVGTVSLSPRGDWRMPSDASAKLYLDEMEALSSEESD